MEIKDFQNVRVGSGWPAAFDIKPIGYHESYGVMAVANTYRLSNFKNSHLIQLRIKKKTNEVALFAFSCDDMALHEGWEDSELVYTSHNEPMAGPTAKGGSAKRVVENFEQQEPT